MSFSSDVKKEICLLINNDFKKAACLYGMLLFSNQFEDNGITFNTEHPEASALFLNCLEDVIGIDALNFVKTSETHKRNSTVLYTSAIREHKCIEKIKRFYNIEGNTFRKMRGENFSDNVSAFICGVFLAAGTVTDPNKEYHLEYITQDFELCNDFAQLMQEQADINLKIMERKGTYVLYSKGSESIEDNFTLMGATQSSLEIMNIKILKDVRNKTNRIANCDTANIEKTIKASVIQVEDIEYIITMKGIDYLSDDLQEIAMLRLENPECSLRELGTMLTKSIGRSGVNHRMKKIAEIAQEIRNEMTEDYNV